VANVTRVATEPIGGKRLSVSRRRGVGGWNDRVQIHVRKVGPHRPRIRCIHLGVGQAFHQPPTELVITFSTAPRATNSRSPYRALGPSRPGARRGW